MYFFNLHCRRCIMKWFTFRRFVDYGSTIMYLLFGIFILIGEPLGISERWIYILSSYVFLIYLLLQGMQVALHKIGSVKAPLVDQVLSWLPVVLWVIILVTAYMPNENIPTWWLYLFFTYLFTSMIDIFIFTWIASKFSLVTNREVVS